MALAKRSRRRAKGGYDLKTPTSLRPAAVWHPFVRIVAAIAAPPKRARRAARQWQVHKGRAGYKRAGYRAIGHAAEANASRLHRRPDVAAACAAVHAEIIAALEDRAFRRAPIRIRGLGWLTPEGLILR